MNAEALHTLAPVIHALLAPLWFIKEAQVFSAWVIFPLLLLSSSSHCSSWNFFLSSLRYSSTHPSCFLVLTLTLPVPFPLLHAVLHGRPLTPPSLILNCGAIIARALLGEPNKTLAGESGWKRPCPGWGLIEVDNGTGPPLPLPPFMSRVTGRL